MLSWTEKKRIGEALAVTFQVPLPPRELSPNGREHWATKGRATAGYREYVGWEAQQARKRARLVEQLPRVRISLVFCTKEAKGRFYQPRDIGNGVAAFKAGFDGIVDAGWMQDDSRKFLELGRVEITAERGPFVEVRIEPCA